MIRLRVFLGTLLALGAIVATLVRAELTEEEKKKQEARKAREEMRAVTSPTPSETPEAKAKPKPAKRKAKPRKSPTPKSKAKTKRKETETPEPTKTPRARKSEAPDPDESPTPKAKKKSAKDEDEPEEEATAKPKRNEKGETPEPTKTPAVKKNQKAEADESPTPKKKKTSEKETPTPTPKTKRVEKAEAVKTPTPKPSEAPPRPPIQEPSAVPRPAPRPTPRPPAPQASLPSDITVEKSGLEREQGFEPPPPPPPRRGFWPFSRQPSNYRYLTGANIEAIRRAPVQRARWKFVIVHNSGTRQGSARVFDYYHRRVRRMRNGLAYHFVIGNGTSTRNGQIEIGERWTVQKSGGHVHSDYMNNIGLGICLVGDFNRDQPTRAQLEACEELIKYLQERCGKMAVRPHREVNPPRWATDCPGDVFPYGWFGRFR